MNHAAQIQTFGRYIAGMSFILALLIIGQAGAQDTEQAGAQDTKQQERFLSECYYRGELVEGVGRKECDKGVLLSCRNENCYVRFLGKKRKVQIGPLVRPNVSQASPTNPFQDPIIQDPFCAWYEQHDMVCPTPPGGGHPPTNGDGIPPTNGFDWDCTNCTVRYTACFVSCSIGWFPGCLALCTKRYIDCAQDYCE